MRTALFVLSGFLLLAATFIVAKLFSAHVSSATTWATAAFVVLWLAITVPNMWAGVTKAGYSAMDELPIVLLLFVVPGAIAVVVRWKLG